MLPEGALESWPTRGGHLLRKHVGGGVRKEEEEDLAHGLSVGLRKRAGGSGGWGWGTLGPGGQDRVCAEPGSQPPKKHLLEDI